MPRVWFHYGKSFHLLSFLFVVTLFALCPHLTCTWSRRNSTGGRTEKIKTYHWLDKIRSVFDTLKHKLAASHIFTGKTFSRDTVKEKDVPRKRKADGGHSHENVIQINYVNPYISQECLGCSFFYLTFLYLFSIYFPLLSVYHSLLPIFTVSLFFFIYVIGSFYHSSSSSFLFLFLQSLAFSVLLFWSFFYFLPHQISSSNSSSCIVFLSRLTWNNLCHFPFPLPPLCSR